MGGLTGLAVLMGGARIVRVDLVAVLLLPLQFRQTWSRARRVCSPSGGGELDGADISAGCAKVADAGISESGVATTGNGVGDGAVAEFDVLSGVEAQGPSQSQGSSSGEGAGQQGEGGVTCWVPAQQQSPALTAKTVKNTRMMDANATFTQTLCHGGDNRQGGKFRGTFR